MRPAQLTITGIPLQPSREGACVSRWHQQARGPILDDLAQTAVERGNHGQRARHGLYRGQAKSLDPGVAWHRCNIALRPEPRQVVRPADEGGLSIEAELLCQLPQRGTLRSISCDEQASVDALAQ